MIHEPIRVVVADSSPLARGVFQSLPAGEVTVKAFVRSRIELERVVAGSKIDVIVCSDDLSGPYGGIEALRALREGQRVSLDTAFLVLVANASREHLMACMQAKPECILIKPFSLQTLTHRLHLAVHHRRQLSSLRRYEADGKWTELLAESRFRQSLAGGALRTAAPFEAKALQMMGLHSELDTFYESVLSSTPGILWAEEALARRELERGAHSSAEDRLRRLLISHPAHIEAHEMLADVLLRKGDKLGAQEHLLPLLRFSGNADKHRELGHLALVNGDAELSQQAYAAALRQPYNQHAFKDLVNLVRSQLLNGDVQLAGRTVTQHRLTGIKDELIARLDYFVTGARARAQGNLVYAQTQVHEGLDSLKAMGDDAPPELGLGAIEACLNAVLTYQAIEQSQALYKVAGSSMHPLQLEWLSKLHDWAQRAPADEDTLPKGLRGYKRLLA